MTMNNIEEMIPDGWKFWSADFSAVASGSGIHGVVMLHRNPEQMKVWHEIIRPFENTADWPPITASGDGKTFAEAFDNAIQKALSIPVLTRAKK
jgi:hypothetical protein